MKPSSLGEQLGSLGEFIASQRRAAELSLRQLAEQTGVSNPYLSQIERGLRKPSAEVLQQLSKALRVSAETLYVRAGILDPEEHRSTSVEMAVLADQAITEKQKSVLIEVYRSFVNGNSPLPDKPATPAGPRRRAAKKAAPSATETTSSTNKENHHGQEP
jgi:transcriptional regulator with XRE-family HTH domain